jgi:glycosyltransferase involved in cell wall biosynthesis
MDQKQPFFSVIVPTYDRPGKLAGCLQALSLLDYPSNCFEVTVVDDGSKTPPEAVVRNFCDQINITLLTRPWCTTRTLSLFSVSADNTSTMAGGFPLS